LERCENSTQLDSREVETRGEAGDGEKSHFPQLRQNLPVCRLLLSSDVAFGNCMPNAMRM